MKIGGLILSVRLPVRTIRRMVYKLRCAVSHTRIEETPIDPELEAVADEAIRQLDRAMLVVDWRHDSARFAWPTEVQMTLDYIDRLAQQ